MGDKATTTNQKDCSEKEKSMTGANNTSFEAIKIFEGAQNCSNKLIVLCNQFVQSYSTFVNSWALYNIIQLHHVNSTLNEFVNKLN
jgi:hypothetical protein